MMLLGLVSRWIFRTIIWAVALLLLSVAITGAVFWYRGQFINEVFQYHSERGPLRFSSLDGRVWLERLDGFQAKQLDFINSHRETNPIVHRVQKTPPDITLPDYYQPNPIEIKVSYTRRFGVVVCRTKIDNWMHAFSDRNGIWKPFVEHDVIEFRPWMLFPLAIPFLIMVGLPIARWRRRRRRQRKSHCVCCNYDLRATNPGNCPECGLPFDWRKLGDQRDRDRHPSLVRAITITKWTLATLGVLIAIGMIILWHRAYENIGYADRVSWIGPTKLFLVGSFNGRVLYMSSHNDLPDDRVAKENLGGFHCGSIRWGEESRSLNFRLQVSREFSYYWDALGVTAYKWRYVEWGKHSESDGDGHTIFSIPIWWLMLLGLPMCWMLLRWSLRKPDPIPK